MKIDRGFGQSRILVVDQHLLLADTVALAIRLTGRKAEARSKLSDRLLPVGFDIVILNPRLDSLKGAEGLARLRQHLPASRIVFLQDHLGEDLPDGISLQDADGLVTKTMSVETLLVMINTLEGVDLLQAEWPGPPA